MAWDFAKVEEAGAGHLDAFENVPVRQVLTECGDSSADGVVARRRLNSVDRSVFVRRGRKERFPQGFAQGAGVHARLFGGDHRQVAGVVAVFGGLRVGDLDREFGDGGGNLALTHQRRDGGLDGDFEGIAQQV